MADPAAPNELGGEIACSAHLLEDDGALGPDVSSFTLSPPPPFRLDLAAWVLRRTKDNQVDRWDDQDRAYRRVLHTEAGGMAVAVRQIGPPERPELRVDLRGPGAGLLATRQHVTVLIERSLGLGVDLGDFHGTVGDDPHLGPLAGRFLGMRPPRFHTWTEALTAAVSCQQLTLVVGVQLLNRLAQRYGTPGPDGGHAFPTSSQLAVVDPAELRAMGYSTRKAEVIVDLAERIATGDLELDRLERCSDDEVRGALCELHGIGPWSAEYVMLRGMGRVHVFPGDDVGAQNKLQRLLGLPSRPSPTETRALLERWAPWAGLVYFHLLLDGMADAGLLS